MTILKVIAVELPLEAKEAEKKEEECKLVMITFTRIIRPNKVVVRLRKIKMVVMPLHSVIVYTGALDVSVLD